MPVPPRIDNYTVPGGVKRFVDAGTGERDLATSRSWTSNPAVMNWSTSATAPGKG